MQRVRTKKLQKCWTAFLTALTIMLPLFTSPHPVHAAGFDLSSDSGAWVATLTGDRFDLGQDQQAADSIDLLGNENNPLMYMKYDDYGTPDNQSDDELSLRFRVDKVRKNGAYDGFLWIGMDVDRDGDLDVFLTLQPSQAKGKYDLDLYNAGTGLNNSPSSTSIANSASLVTLTDNVDFRMIPVLTVDGGPTDLDADGDPDEFVSIRFSFQRFADVANEKPITDPGVATPKKIATINNNEGLTKDTPLRFVVASAQQANALNGDIGGYKKGDNTDISYADKGAFSTPLYLGDPGATVPPDPVPDHITLSGPSSVMAGQASSNFTLTVVDAGGQPVNVSADTNFTLSSNSTGTVTFNPTTVTVPAGGSTATFTYTDTKAGDWTVTATGTSLGSATHGITVNPGAPASIQFKTPARTITEGGTSAVITVELLDTHGNPTSGTVALSSDPAVTFRSEANSEDITQITIPPGQSTGSFVVTASTAGTYTLSATAGSASNTQSLTVTEPEAVPDHITLSGPSSVTAGQASSNFTLTVVDAGGQPVNVSADTNFTLSSNSTGTVTFNPATVTVPAGGSTATFTYTDTKAGDWTVTATGTSLGSATHGITVNPGAPAQVAFITDPQTITAGENSGPITLQLQDTYGNPTTRESDTTVSLSSDGAITFIDLTEDQVVIPAGQSTVSFQAAATQKDTHPITAVSDGLTGATQDLNVQVVPHHIALSGPSETTADVPVELTLTVLDINGDPIAVSAPATFSLSTSETEPVTTFNPTSVTVAKDSSTATFTYKDTKAGDKVITATVQEGELGSDTHALTVKADRPHSIHFITDPVTFPAGDTSGLITLQLRDRFGNVATSEGGTIITLASAEGITFVDVINGQVTVPNGDSVVSFQVTTDRPGEYIVAASSAGLIGATQDLTVSPVPVGITLSGPESASAGQAVELTLTVVDANGTAVDVAEDTTFTLTASDPAHSTFDPVQVTVSAGTNSATFTYTDTLPGAKSVTAKDSLGELGEAQHGITITAGAPAAIHFITPPRTVTVGSTSSVITLELRDAHGNVATSVGGTTINLSSDGNLTFVDAVSDQVTVPEGQSSVDFRVRPSEAGVYTLTAASTGLSSAEQGLTAKAATAPPPPPPAPKYTLSISGPSTTDSQTPTISGSTDAPDGTTIRVTVNGNSYTATASGGGWSVTIPAEDALPGGTYTVTASVTNGAGEQTTASQEMEVRIAKGTLAVKIKTDFGQAAAGIAVEVKDSNGTVIASGVTDQAGVLQASLPPGQYTAALVVQGQSASGGATVTSGGTSTINLVVTSTLRLSLTSDPSRIVGDGKSTATLLAKVVTLDGDPAAGVTVQLSATAGTLSTTNTQTNAQGQVTALLTAPRINGTNPVTEQVVATVYDPARGLFAKTTITIHFLPATVAGVVTDAATGRPVAGAQVSIAEDFDGNGTIDFTATSVTGADGRYVIVVPRGEWHYTVTIKTPVIVGDQTIWVTSTQDGDVGELQGVGEQHLASPTMSGLLLMKNGATQQPKTLDQVLPPGAQVQATVRNAAGEPIDQQVTITPEGVFQVEGVEPGTYRIVFQVTAPDGTKLAGTSLTITVTDDGELALQTGLIDPYGVVTDRVTGKPVQGVTMKLYWADHPDNVANGRTPNTLVNLPALPDFPPGSNLVPQVTNELGEYAWMVFPDSWYYIVAEHAGYQTYDSRVEGRNRPAAMGEDSFIQNGLIYVGSAIVEYSLTMEPISAGGGTPGGGTGPVVGGGVTPGRAVDPEIVIGSNEVVAEELGTHLRYIQGYPDGLFRPERSITRAEVATILTRITGPITAADDAALYPDVAAAHWAARNIKAARARGLMLGDPDGRFRPEDPISRAEVAVIALRFKQLQLMTGSAFPDTPGHWADSTIYTVTTAGLLEGYPDGTYRPNQPITRAEFVTVINRLLERGPLFGLPAPTFSDVAPAYWAYGQVEEAATSHRYRRVPGHEEWIEAVPHPIW